MKNTYSTCEVTASDTANCAASIDGYIMEDVGFFLVSKSSGAIYFEHDAGKIDRFMMTGEYFLASAWMDLSNVGGEL